MLDTDRLQHAVKDVAVVAAIGLGADGRRAGARDDTGQSGPYSGAQKARAPLRPAPHIAAATLNLMHALTQDGGTPSMA